MQAEAALAALEEGELLALRAIFSPEDLVIHREHPAGLRLQVLGLRGGCTACLALDPLAYPAAPPRCEVEGLRRGEAAGVLAAAAALGQALAGSPMLFELIGLLRERLGAQAGGGDCPAPEGALALTSPPPPPPPPPQLLRVQLVCGAPETHSKSAFQGFAARVRSVEEVRAVLAHIAALPRVARATHPAMHAYRIPTAEGALLADNDDDGEAGAGAKLAQLLVNMGAAGAVGGGGGVLVVVARWYGGIPLGPARFGIIANVARKALVEALEGGAAGGGGGGGAPPG
jgi:hypothetical protein